MADFGLPGPAAPAGAPATTLALALVERHDIDDVWSGAAANAWEATVDALPFRATRGLAGDHLFTHGDAAWFWLSPDRATLLCAPREPSALTWRRVLLDSVLLTVALLAGYEALHAAAADLGGVVVAVAAPTGTGKSSLAAALVRRGAALMADDVLALTRTQDTVVAHPAPAVMSIPTDPARTRLDGEVLERAGDELWIVPQRMSRSSGPVGAVVLLARAPGLPLRLRRLPSTPLDLLGHSLYFDHDARRSRARFELFADLARQAPIYALEAPMSAPADALADTLMAGLGGTPAHGARVPAGKGDR